MRSWGGRRIDFKARGFPPRFCCSKSRRRFEMLIFIDASREYEHGKNQNRPKAEHIEKNAAAYKSRWIMDKYAYVAEFAEIEENDFNLNIPRYVEPVEEEEEIDIRLAQEGIDALDPELAQAHEQMAGYRKELKLLE